MIIDSQNRYKQAQHNYVNSDNRVRELIIEAEQRNERIQELEELVESKNNALSLLEIEVTKLKSQKDNKSNGSQKLIEDYDQKFSHSVSLKGILYLQILYIKFFIFS